MRTDILVKFKSFINNWGAGIISLTAGFFYIFQALNIAKYSESILDEGAYLFKGYLFLTGQYTPYQEYGPWTNKMPFSFLIPGSIQYLFGPDLGVGRCFSVTLAVLMLLGLWILVNRLGGKWWAAGIVSFFALNPYIIYDYTLAVSQVLVACMLAWMLVLVVGSERVTWHILLGSLLAGLIVMTRINMFPIVPILVLYIYWEHGLKTALLAAVACAIPIVIGNALFWPEILTRYAFLFPRSITPFLNQWRVPYAYASLWNPVIEPLDRLLSFLLAFHIQFTALAGVIIAWLLWRPKRDWENQSKYRSSVFLSALFISLLLFHFWVALGNDFCIYCFTGYMSFFSFIGLLLIVITFSNWRSSVPVWFQVMLPVFILIFAIIMGYGTFPEIGYQLLETRVPATLKNFPELELIRLQKFLKTEFKIAVSEARRQVPTILGFGVGMLILAFGYELWFRSARIRESLEDTNQATPSYSYWLLIAFLIIGTLLTPSVYKYKTQNDLSCKGDVITAHRIAGQHLAELIPPGSQVYWGAGGSFTPLLYVPGVSIYPPQINGAYSYKLGGYSNPDSLLKFGLWNSVLDYKWQHEADYALLLESAQQESPNYYILFSGEFEELESTPPLDPCDENSRIRVFERIP